MITQRRNLPSAGVREGGTVVMRAASPSSLCPAIGDCDLLADVRSRTGGIVVGEFAEVLAGTEGRLSDFWRSVRPCVDSGAVFAGAAELRRAASVLATTVLDFSDHLEWLRKSGHGREDQRQIRYVVEAFHYLEPVSAVLAVAAALWAMGHVLPEPVATTACTPVATQPVFTARLLFAHVPDTLVIPGTSRHPSSPHAFNAALAVWPRYLENVLTEMSPVAYCSDWARALETMEVTAFEIGDAIVAGGGRMPYGSSETLGEALLGCIRRSCAVTVTASALRRAFIAAEVRARESRTRECDCPKK